MPNPYHDGQGRFCSKGEMRVAVDAALKAGDIDSYFTLRKEYEDIAKESLSVTTDQLKTQKEKKVQYLQEKLEEPEEPYPDGTFPSEYSGGTNPQSMKEHDNAVKNAGGEYNSNLGGYKFPDGTFISTFYYPGRGGTYGVYPPGTSMWSKGHRVPKFGKIQDALKNAGLDAAKPSDTTHNFVRLSKSPTSDSAASEIATSFEEKGIALNSEQTATLSHIFYHIEDEGYEEGAYAERYARDLKEFDRKAEAETIVKQLKLADGVVVPTTVHAFVEDQVAATWERGVYNGGRDV